MKARAEAKCMTCGRQFSRRFARQRKCGACRYSNIYRCARCSSPYERCDDIRVCPNCLKNLRPPTGEDAREWDRHLALTGNATSRGASVGPATIVYEHELPPPEGEDSPSPLESIADERANPEEKLIGEELLRWFLSGTASEVANLLGLKREQVQRLRAEFLGVDRAEIESARQVLGYTEAQWQQRKLGLALVKARADGMREKLRAA